MVVNWKWKLGLRAVLCATNGGADGDAATLTASSWLALQKFSKVAPNIYFKIPSLLNWERKCINGVQVFPTFSNQIKKTWVFTSVPALLVAYSVEMECCQGNYGCALHYKAVCHPFAPLRTPPSVFRVIWYCKGLFNLHVNCSEQYCTPISTHLHQHLCLEFSYRRRKLIIRTSVSQKIIGYELSVKGQNFHLKQHMKRILKISLKKPSIPIWLVGRKQEQLLQHISVNVVLPGCGPLTVVKALQVAPVAVQSLVFVMTWSCDPRVGEAGTWVSIMPSIILAQTAANQPTLSWTSGVPIVTLDGTVISKLRGSKTKNWPSTKPFRLLLLPSLLPTLVLCCRLSSENDTCSRPSWFCMFRENLQCKNPKP